MKIAVLFDGAGLARLGLEQSGHETVGVELDPWKHYLSKFVGSGNCVLGDATKFDLDPFDAIWASPPCILRSVARHKDTKPRNELYAVDYVQWCLDLVKKYPNKPIWVECTMSYIMNNDWGTKYNAAQFLEEPIQCRNRIIGGNYIAPKVFRPYKKFYKEKDICPAILASEYKAGRHRATEWYAKKTYEKLCPAITATEHKGCATEYQMLGDKSQKNSLIGNGLSISMKP
jgi:hypothetical protein